MIDMIELQQWRQGCNGFIITKGKLTYITDYLNMELDNEYLVIYFHTNQNINWIFDISLIDNINYNSKNDLVECEFKIGNISIKLKAY